MFMALARLLTELPTDETIEIVRSLAETNDEMQIGDALLKLGTVASTPRGQIVVGLQSYFGTALEAEEPQQLPFI